MANFLLPASLALAFAFGVVGSGIGLNALIKSDRDQDHLRQAAGALSRTARLEIDISDAHSSGIVVTVCCLLIAVTTVLALGHHFVFGSRASAKGGAVRKIFGGLMALWTIWLLATLIAFDVIFATREADVRVFLGDTQLAKSTVDALGKRIGATTVYNDIWYLRLLAILPWFTFLFSTIATAMLFKAHQPAVHRDDSLTNMDEKSRTEHIA